MKARSVVPCKQKNFRKAAKIAERWALRARHRQAHGFQVIATPVGVLLEKYGVYQESHVNAGQLLSAKKSTYNTAS